ncbi:MAG: hypothetical protein F6K36_12645 [Symploca sp. SIO3C6]|nr:hypothetical protein [Symploca sp. SIO3C6]
MYLNCPLSTNPQSDSQEDYFVSIVNFEAITELIEQNSADAIHTLSIVAAA